jgi:hypothetical protein
MLDEITKPNPVNRRRPFWRMLQTEHDTWFDFLFVPVLLLIQILVTIWVFLLGDFILGIVSLLGIALMLGLALSETVKTRFLRQRFTRSHAVYAFIFWVYSLLFGLLYQRLLSLPAIGKESQNFYIFLLLFLAVTFRLLLALFALTPIGYKVFFSKIPVWEQFLIAINEFVAAALFAFVLGAELAHFLQPSIFSLRVDIYYTTGLLFLTGLYYFIMQAMWIQPWNQALSHNNVWIRFARIVTPIALVVATMVIVRHFANLSDTRTANLLGTSNINQTILALSPLVWMMIFFILIIVYSGNRGLRNLFLPNKLLELLPERLARLLRTVSDMDILLLFGAFATFIPVQIFLFNDRTFIGELQSRLQGNALIYSSEQALALIFSLPFYILAVLLLALYAYVMANPRYSAQTRDTLVDRLPITLLMIFIITLYLAAIPFSQVLTSGRIPDLRSDLGYILAYDILIPFIIFYLHYYLLIRIPYGRGQSRWRLQYARELESKLRDVNTELATLQSRIEQSEVIWKNRGNLRSSSDQQIDMLFDLIELNSKRDQLNMNRLQHLADRQELQEISEAPISLTIAQMPNRIIQYGIPLILLFKIYEWAIVNDGLREVVNNPNIGVLEFFQKILENSNF